MVPVVLGVAVCQGQSERPLCFSTDWYEKTEDRPMGLN